MVTQRLIHYQAACHTCGKACGARNAQAWATNHVRNNPGHFAEVSLGYALSDAAGRAEAPR